MNDWKQIGKAALIFLLALYGANCAFNPSKWHLLDGVDLVVHEAGHLLFGYFGQFIGVAGGTLGQLLVPSALSVYFYLYQSRFASTVPLFWLGQSLINVSVYVKDAQAMALPLVSIGGGDAIHDWHFMLSRLGLLRHDQLIGNTIYVSGILIIVSAIVMGFLWAFRTAETNDQDNPTTTSV
jgi:hypothetical protein